MSIQFETKDEELESPISPQGTSFVFTIINKT